MPGFGSGEFGGAVFGQFDWSRRVLFETAPEVYRTADLENNDLLRRYAEAQGGSFDNLRLKIADFADLRDPRRVRTQYNETTVIRLGAIELAKGPVEQQGVRGYVSGVRAFTAPRGRFTFADVGKELTVTGSVIETNNTKVVVTNIVSPTEVLTNPPLALDAGLLRWELRVLEAATQKETLVKVIGGDVEVITPGWILSDGFADFTVLSRTQFKAAEDEWKLLTLREGANGSINTSLQFTSPTLALTSRDVGRRLTVANSLYSETNDGKFEIVDVLSATVCVLDSTTIVFEPTGELVWALLRDPELVLQGSATLTGHVEQAGDDGSIDTATNFSAVSAKFLASDEGKLLTLHKPGSADNGTYEVTSVVSSTEVVLDVTFTTFVATAVRWELRTPSEIGDETQVEVRAPSLLQYLAQDFGIEIDTREEEEWQRRWAESVSRWIGLKGHEDGYAYLAELTGFTAQVSALYRMGQEIYLTAQAAGANVYAVGEDGDGRYGLDGSLDVVSGHVRFFSPTASFQNWDEGRQIEVSGTAGATNDGLRTVATVVDSTTVEFRLADTMAGTADGNNGTIVWRVVRLYSDEAPTLPVYDEINADLMTYLKTAAVFTVDKYCWEQSPSPWSALIGPGDAGDGRLFITSVDPPGASAFPVPYTLEGRGDFEVATGLGEGFWRLTDSGSVAHFLESVPTLHKDYEGSDGALAYLFANNVFGSTSQLFTAADVGKVLITWNGAVMSNNKAWLITGQFIGGALVLSPAQALTDDPNSGSLEWEVLDPDATGTDGVLTSPRRFTSASATFTAVDEGKRLIVSESGSSNNRIFVIETYVDANTVDLAPYDSPTVPDANNGSLVWAMVSSRCTVVATSPPAVGAATLEYICPERMSCSFCKSNKVLVEASTPYLLEKGFERSRSRLAQVTPAHVEIIEDYGVEVSASLALTVTVDAP